MTSFLLPLDIPSTEAALRDATSELAESRWIAAMALGGVQGSNEKVLSALFKLVSDPVEEVRAQAIEGLLEQHLAGASVSSDFATLALQDLAPCVRCAAVDAVTVFENSPEDVIVNLLDDEDPSVRATAVSAIGELKAKNKIEQVVGLLSDTSDYVAFEAAMSLAELGDGRGEKVLIASLKGKASDALDAALALGRLGLPTSSPALKKTAKRNFAPIELKAMAAAAMIRCSDNAGLPILEHMLEGRRQSTRMTALTVIARLPVREIKASLEKLTSSGVEMEASAALETLEVIEQEANRV